VAESLAEIIAAKSVPIRDVDNVGKIAK